MNQAPGRTRYEEAVAYLNGFIDYEKKRSDQFAPEAMDVGRPARLLAALGDPHLAYPVIHIAGTKGKGSTAAFCAAVLRAAGYRVGLYTSPHLLDIRERFRVLTPADEQGWASEAAFATLVNAVKEPVTLEPGLTWFEIFTALAFLHFAREKVEVAVVEVGLGGRLDATNVVLPLVSVISSISLDHISLLGDTLAAIAREKGGIIKPGVPVVIAPQAAVAREALLAIAVVQEAPVTEIGREWQGETRPLPGPGQELLLTQSPANALLRPGQALALGLLGAYQGENALLALAALHLAQPALPRLDENACRAGLRDVVWPGRLQRLPTPAGRPALVTDGAHNGDSAGRLVVALRRHFTYSQLIIVMASGVDKDYEAMLGHFLPAGDRLILTAAAHPRSAPPALLLQAAIRLAPAGSELSPQVAPDLQRALQLAFDAAEPSALICVTGSLFLVAELLKEWQNWRIL